VKKALLTALKLVFFFGLGFLLIWLSVRNLGSGEREQILQSFREANYFWVVLAMIIGVGSHFIRALRWNLLLGTFTQAPRASSTFLAVMSGYLANLAIPRLGEITRCSILYKTDRIPVEKSLGSVITERSIDMLTFLLLFFIAFLWQFDLLQDYVNQRILPGFEGKLLNFSNPFFWVGLVLVILILLMLVLFRKKLSQYPLFRKAGQLLQGLLHGILSVLKVRSKLLFLLYTLLIWVMYFLMVYLCFFSLQESAHLGPGAGLAVLTLGTVGIIVTPGGIGLYPLIVAETLLLYNTSYTSGLALGWIAWSSQTLLIIITGSISLVLAMTKKRKDVQA
jgi:glycosyltransferase 2 family protein